MLIDLSNIQNIAEIDFLVQYKNRVIPMEVKSDENVRSKSLSFYPKTYNPELVVRYSLKNLPLEDNKMPPIYYNHYNKIPPNVLQQLQ